MNGEAQQSNSTRGDRAANLIGRAVKLISGILITIVWFGGLLYCGLFVFMFDGFGMAAPFGPDLATDIIVLIMQFVGFVLVGIAGILCGASIYCPSHRKRLLGLFWRLLVAGVLVFIFASGCWFAVAEIKSMIWPTN